LLKSEFNFPFQGFFPLTHLVLAARSKAAKPLSWQVLTLRNLWMSFQDQLSPHGVHAMLVPSLRRAGLKRNLKNVSP